MATGDKFANIITEEVTMSAANTLTFDEVTIGLSLFDKAGILISRIEYEPWAAGLAEMTTANDKISIAITSSNQLTNLNSDQAAVVDRIQLQRIDFGTAGNAHVYKSPIIKDFANLPGGGLLITPKPWYVGMDSTGLASAASCWVRFYFTVMKLSPQDYFELLETRTFFG